MIRSGGYRFLNRRFSFSFRLSDNGIVKGCARAVRGLVDGSGSFSLGLECFYV